MQLEKLKILGFKSFAKKTVLNFTEGTTGVVGPNGCGKSNVVDAIRWVLGEQRAGTLRGDRMESVIFNGTKDVKPLGMAEVSLVIKNTKNILPVEYSEVVITRRLFRSGESQYLVNNSVCRLKDINDLLMDTGMAADAYSVIELSMVESILSGRPEERKRIFEEAAGITKYKKRRKISRRKLESTESDLVRIEDILSEVESKVNSLKRQVRRAQRYQELTSSLKELEIKAATFKYSNIYCELEPLSEQLDEKNRERETSTAQVSFKEAELESLRTKLIEIEQKLRNSQQELNNINNIIRKNEEEILVNRERGKSLIQSNERIQSEITELQNKIIEQKNNSKKITVKMEMLQKKAADSETIYSEEKTQLEQLEQKFRQKQEESKQSATAMRQYLEQISGFQGNIEHLKGSIKYLQSRIDELYAEKGTVNNSLSVNSDELSKIKQQKKESDTQLENLYNNEEQLIKRNEQIVISINEAKDEITKGFSQLDTLKQRISILNKLLENYSDYPEGVRHVMLQNKGYSGTIADIISVPDKYQRSIETILGESATYLIVEDDKQAFLEIKSLKEAVKGVVSFLPLTNIRKNSGVRPYIDFDKYNNNDVLGWADDIVDCDSKYKQLLNVLIGDYLLVKDLLTLENYPELKSQDSLNIVTLSGEMITNWGCIKGGKKSHDDSGFVGRRDQLKNFQNQVEEIQSRLSELEDKKQNLETEQKDVLEKKKEVEQNIIACEKDISEHKISVSQINYRIEQSTNRNQAIDNEIKTLKDDLQLTQDKINNSNNDLENLKQKRTSTDGDIIVLNKNLEALNNERESLAQKVHQTHLNFVQLKNDEKNITNELERCKNFIDESNVAIKNKYKEIADNEASNTQITDRIEFLSESLIKDYEQKEKFEETVSKFEQEQATLKEQGDEIEKVTRELRRERESSSESIHNIELRIAELKLNADNLFRKISEEYNANLKREQIEDSYDLDADEQEIEKIKNRLKNLGPVNLLALKEYDSEKERYDFLKTQRDDLVEAKQNLNDTITQINATARDMFIEVFSEIRTNFTAVFDKFFPHGDADLVLSDSQDPLESDIEILANPKGKRPTSLMLLSGGEKALTAISLLFAIYLVKPSPFCILDEVDAPLDDRNIERFTNTIREFSENTQFLIVTHNKLTMKAANSLYGITMETPGISKVVSVKID